MSSQREHSLDSFFNETRELKERMKQFLPSHIASLKEVSSLPQEFERRFWASRLEALLETVRADYENFQAQAQKVDFLGKFMTVGIDVVLKAGGMQPIAPPPPIQLSVAISPAGKIEPTVLDESLPQRNAIVVSIARFEAIIRELKGGIMKGKTLPRTEEEIPRLVYSLALELPKGDKQ